MGLSIGPIPWHRIRDYAEYTGLDDENAFAFMTIIRLMDAAYLQSVGEQQAADASRARASAAAKARGPKTRTGRGRIA